MKLFLGLLLLIIFNGCNPKISKSKVSEKQKLSDSVTNLIKVKKNYPYSLAIEWLEYYLKEKPPYFNIEKKEGRILDPLQRSNYADYENSFDSIRKKEFFKKVENSIFIEKKDSIRKVINKKLNCGYIVIDFGFDDNYLNKTLNVIVEFSDDLKYTINNNVLSEKEKNDLNGSLIDCRLEVKKVFFDYFFGYEINDIEKIVYSNNLNRISIPEGIQEEMIKVLNNSKNILPDSLKSKVEDVTLDFSDENESRKVFFIENLNNQIRISPRLIRTLFLTIASEMKSSFILRYYDDIYNKENDNKRLLDNYFNNNPYDYKLFYQSLIYTNKYYDNSIANFEYEFYEFVTTEFRRSLYFIVGHELAHIYLENDSEENCDCYSAKFIQQSLIGLEKEDRVFKIILDSFNQEQLKLWNWNNDQEHNLKKRIAHIESLILYPLINCN